MRSIKLIFAALLSIVLLGNIATPQSGSVVSTQATAQPGVHVSPLPSPLATPEPRSDEQQERRAARREAKRAAQQSALNWAEPRR